MDLQQQRQRLHSRIDTFSSEVSTFLTAVTIDEEADTDEVDNMGPGSWSSGSSEAESNPPSIAESATMDDGATIYPENLVLNLPSCLGRNWCSEPGNAKIASQELQLRQGQANEALHQIRIALGKKSFMYRTSVRNANSQQKKTRAWRNIHSVDAVVRLQATIYRSARSAMVSLGASDELLARYRKLEQADLVASTAVIDVRLPTRAEATLAWFWNMDVTRDTTSDSWMAECMW